jgi:hypothetical protein
MTGLSWSDRRGETAASGIGLATQRSQSTIATTLLNLVQTVQDHAATDDEVVAVISHLLDSGRVKLAGIFADHRTR